MVVDLDIYISGRFWSKDVVRIVCISDTHSRTGTMPTIPPGDVLIHAGDFSSTAEGFDPLKYSQECRDAICLSEPPAYTYLQDSSTVIVPPVTDSTISSPGIEVYGAPWQPAFCNWAFNLLPGSELKEKWDLIPDSTDVLITHGPPRTILDLIEEGDYTGCALLREAITERVKPRLHIFGHIHEGYGTHFDGTTTFVNACTCTRAYRPSNPPIVIDLPLDPTMPAVVVNKQQTEKLARLLRKSF
eukprot:gene9632-11324_t